MSASASTPGGQIRHNWTLDEAMALFAMPMMDLLYRAQGIHREYFPGNTVQASTLLSIKTGGCPEDCKYCPQSARYDTPVSASKLLDVDSVLEAAADAKASGASRFCMGAAWRSPKERDMPKLEALIKGVKAMGLETCMTLGMIDKGQAETLKEAGLDYYNHNIDTSEAYYKEIITTRTYQDRLDTLANVRESGMKVCCGGIVGMGETREDRAAMLVQLATLPAHPESVPINMLVQVAGTPFEHLPEMDAFEFVRTIAIARIMMPASYVRLSAGREEMPATTQALCFMAGANSIFFGEKLLTTANPAMQRDLAMLEALGLTLEGQPEPQGMRACA